MRMTDDDLPIYLYVFDAQGMHSGKQTLANMTECEAAIRIALENKQTVTITDSGDDCVFRCEGGRIVWPRLDKLFPSNDSYGFDLTGLL